MVCHECGAAVEPDQRFCTLCGAVVEGVTHPTEQIAASPTDDEPTPAPDDDAPAASTAEPAAAPASTDDLSDDEDPWIDDDPVWAATAPVPVSTTLTADLPATHPALPAIPPTSPPPPPPYDLAADSSAVPVVEAVPFPATAQFPAVPVRPPRVRIGPVTVIGVLAGALALASTYVDILSITSDTEIAPSTEVPTFRTGTWILTDIADNLPIAVLLAAVALVAGGVAAAFRWSWGAGLAAGGGLALAGLSALAIGLTELPVDAAHQLAAIPSEQTFRLTVTRDLGYWLLLATGVVGVVLFFAAIGDAIADRRHGLNPWIAALGALAALVTGAGPLVPVGQAAFVDNFYVDGGPSDPPSLLLVARLVQLGLLVFGGVAGFLLVRRWGLGLVAGATLPVIWLAASTLLELGDTPVGPAYRNPGASRVDVHGVTALGATALLAVTLLAVVAAYDQTVRDRG